MTYFRDLAQYFCDWAKMHKKIPLFIGVSAQTDREQLHGQMYRWVEEMGEPLSLLEADYPDGHTVPSHQHSYIQLLYILTGVIAATTEQGCWMVPAGHALWIPAWTMHSWQIVGSVKVHSLFVHPEAIEDLPRTVRVIGLTDLARSLLTASLEVEADAPPTRRDDLLRALLLQELAHLPEKPLSLPFPQTERLMALCLAFNENPDPHVTIDDWAAQLHISRRTFTRTFSRETGLSFSQWKQQACLLAALPRLATGQPITRVALDLGYESAAAFSTMFRRILGVSPREYLADASNHAE